MKEPVLVSSTDGVGTKLMVARRVGRFDTVGADLVNHCVNDILVMGAEPLFFLDYIAAGKLTPELMGGLLAGFANACREQGVALVGGETAEMPGLYRPEDFDLAGFIVGVVDRPHILAPDRASASARSVHGNALAQGYHHLILPPAHEVALDHHPRDRT
jgi:phosphoribosylformylglycinamidine cyclo-ligase